MLVILSMIIGFSASLVSGLFGGGSGLVTVPSIYWLLVHNYPGSEHYMQVTLATGCVMAIPLGAVATWRQFQYKNVDIETLKRLLPNLLAGSLFGAFTIDYLHSHTLTYIFSVATFLMGIWMWRFKMDVAAPFNMRPVCYRILAALVGYLSALLGASVFTVPFLMKSGLDIRKAIGTATVMVFSYCLFIGAWFIYLGIGELNLPPQTLGFLSLPIFLSTIIPGMIASLVAVRVVNTIPRPALKAAFVCLMFVVSILMMFPH